MPGKRGQVALPFVLLIGGIVAEIVIAGSIVAFFMSSQTLGEQLALRSLSAAYAGVHDGIMRVSSNKELASGSDVSYSVTVGSDSVDVVVSRSTDNANNTYVFTISADASARLRRRKVVAQVVANQTTGLIDVVSIGEQAL